MKKLKLDLDELQIESFATTPGTGPGGTVYGFQTEQPEWYTCYPGCGSGAGCSQGTTCSPAASCYATCALSCGAQTCGNTDCPVETCDYPCASGFYTCDHHIDTCQDGCAGW